MAKSAKQIARIESEIEKYRTDCNWEKLSDFLIQSSPKKSSNIETLVSLALGESILEKFILENPLLEENIDVAKKCHKLDKAKGYLIQAVTGKDILGLAWEARLLLGKLHYSYGEYEQTLQYFDKADLSLISVNDLSQRQTRLVAESFALMGLATENLLKSGRKKKNAEIEAKIVSSYEKAGNLIIIYLQESEKYRPTSSGNLLSSNNLCASNQLDYMGIALETAIQSAPILSIENGKIDNGINSFRELLKAVECYTTQSFRMTLARQLSEVLLRGVWDTRYKIPMHFTLEKSNTLTRIGNSFKTDTCIPRQYNSDKTFIPKKNIEEILLLLFISESLATKDAVLSRSEEDKSSTRHSLENAEAVYDLLTVTLVRRGQFEVLTKSFEHSMKFAFDEFHLWFQFALSLIASEQFSRALLVLKQCLVLDPKNEVVLLLAIKLCFNYLHKLDQGMNFAFILVSLGDNEKYVSLGHLAIGIGYNQKATEALTQTERQDLQKKSLQSLYQAYHLDKNNYSILYNLALQLAICRQITEAYNYVKKALEINGEHLESLHLISLILSAKKEYRESLAAINFALAEYTDHTSLLFTKMKIEELCHNSEEALGTCHKLLDIWKQSFDHMQQSDASSSLSTIEKGNIEKKSMIHLQATDLSDMESGSIHNSLTASRVEQTLSEVASSYNSYTPRQGPHQLWFNQAQIWLASAELYLKMDKINEASACVLEASNSLPLSHLVMFMQGNIFEKKGDIQEANNCYMNALAINSVHIKSLQHLAMILHVMGNNSMAEKLLRDAINVDPYNHFCWKNLGRVLESESHFKEASECFQTALELESSSPALPFTTLPHLL